MVWEGRGGVGGGLEASDNHNVSNVKSDTYIKTPIDPLEYDLTILFDQAVNDSQSC